MAGVPGPHPLHHQPGFRARGALVLPLRVDGRLRAASARGRKRPERHLHQDHPVPPGQPVALGRGADRRRGKRQAGHGAVRAARPLRRVEQHRVVAALRGSRLQRHLRFPRLQGAQQDLLHHAPNRTWPAAHHAAWHGQLQREDGQALHRPVVHHGRRDHRARRDGVLPQHAAGERFRQLRHSVGGAAADQAGHHRGHRQADRAGAGGQAVRAVLQDEQRDRQGDHRQAGRGEPGRRAHHPARARHFVPGAGRGGLHRQRARGFDRRAFAGA